MTYVGIDLHTTNMVIVAINSNGEVIREEKLPASPVRYVISKFVRQL